MDSKTLAEAAKKLGRTPRTVQDYRDDLYRFLRVSPQRPRRPGPAGPR